MSQDIYRDEDLQDIQARSNAIVVDEFIDGSGFVDVSGAINRLWEVATITRLITLNSATDVNPILTGAALDTNFSLMNSLRKLLVERANLPAKKVDDIIRAPHKHRFINS